MNSDYGALFFLLQAIQVLGLFAAFCGLFFPGLAGVVEGRLESAYGAILLLARKRLSRDAASSLGVKVQEDSWALAGILASGCIGVALALLVFGYLSLSNDWPMEVGLSLPETFREPDGTRFVQPKGSHLNTGAMALYCFTYLSLLSAPALLALGVTLGLVVALEGLGRRARGRAFAVLCFLVSVFSFILDEFVLR